MYQLGLFQEVAEDISNLLMRVRVNARKVEERSDGEKDWGGKESETINGSGPVGVIVRAVENAMSRRVRRVGAMRT